MDPFFVRNAFTREFVVDVDFDGALTDLRSQWQFSFQGAQADRVFAKRIFRESGSIIISFEIPDTFFHTARVGDCSSQVVLYDDNDHHPVWFSDIFYNSVRAPILEPY